MGDVESGTPNRRPRTVLACLGAFILFTVSAVYTGWVGNWVYDNTKPLPTTPNEGPEDDPFIKGLQAAQVK